MNLKQTFQLLARKLTTHGDRARRGQDWDLSDIDLFDLESGDRATNLFLGKFSEAELKDILQECGFFRALKKKGFRQPGVRVSTGDRYRHGITLTDGSGGGDPVLGELFLKRDTAVLRPPFDHPLRGQHLPILAIEWLLMQHPGREFTRERPRLPGQEHPGLGMIELVLKLLLHLCHQLDMAALQNVPAHYHNAAVYAAVFRYLDPHREGRLQALKRDLKGHSLAKISWAVAWGCVLDEERGDSLEWTPAPRLVALDRELKAFFQSDGYRGSAAAVRDRCRFRLDEARFASARARHEGDGATAGT